MKAVKDYLQTSLWYKEKITDPYQVIAEFFCSAGLTAYRKCIKDALRAASGNHIGENITQVICYMILKCQNRLLTQPT